MNADFRLLTTLRSGKTKNNNNNRNNKNNNNNNNKNSDVVWSSPFGKNFNKKASQEEFQTREVPSCFKTKADKRNQNEEPQSKDSRRLDKLANRNKRDMEFALVNDFVNDCIQNRINATQMFSMVCNEFPQVADIVIKTYRQSDNNPDLMGVVNSALDVMSTKVFATTLISLVKDGNFNPSQLYEFGKIIALCLNTKADIMHDDTISIYVEIVSEYIYESDIAKMVDNIGISSDMAVDLCIAFPSIGGRWNEFDRKNSAKEFIATVINHKETSSQIMDAENMFKLFYFIFPEYTQDDGNKSLQALKSLGTCLAYEKIDLSDEVEQALYDEYIKFLYGALNDYDITDIKTVLKYVARTAENAEKVGKEPNMVFDADIAQEYENIAKAMATFK